MDDDDLDSAIMDTEDEFTDDDDDYSEDSDATVESDTKLASPASSSNSLLDIVPVTAAVVVACWCVSTFYNSPNKVALT